MNDQRRGAHEYMFGPDSMMWKINRESVLLLGGRPALLMQLAHPLVAAGVGDHSDFREGPLKRLRRTLEATLTIVFGDVQAAHNSVARINAVHATVKGTSPEGVEYSALDPRLLLWVHATLIDSAVKVYEYCFGPIEPDELERYYEETRVIAELFGIPDSLTPGSLDAMRAWMDGLIDSGEVRVTDQARELAEPILRPLRVVPRRLAKSSAFVAASMLPEPIREGYGLKVSRPARTFLAVGGRASRALLPRVPQRLRSLPFFGTSPALRRN